MHRILCYGDSNTRGYIPGSGERFDEKTRWTSVMSNYLGNNFCVIEEGLDGRTTVFDDPNEMYKNGMCYLMPCLESHQPLDLVIIMLGTNDLKSKFSVSSKEIARGVGELVRIVQQSKCGFGGVSPRVLMVAPPPVAELGILAEMFIGAADKSKNFAIDFKDVADNVGCDFFDAGQVVASSNVDGIHFDKESHLTLAKMLTERVQSLIG